MPDLSNFRKELQAKMGLETAGLNSGFAKIGKGGGAAIAAGLAAAGIGKALYDIGKNFDDATDKIRVGTGATGKRLEGLRNDLKATYGQVPSSLDDTATAITKLNARLHLTGKPLQNLAKQELNLSRITKTDLNENLDATSRLFGDWKSQIKSPSDAMDRLFRLTQKTNIPLSDLSRLMVQFGSPLRQLGFHFDNAAAMFGKFEAEGVNLQTLMPGFRFALKNLSAPIGEAAAKMDELGISTKNPQKALGEIFKDIKNAKSDLQANSIAFAIFGRRAGPDMAAAIREGRFSVKDLLDTMRNGKGTIQKSTDQTDDAKEHWTEFAHKLQNLVEPAARHLFDLINSFDPNTALGSLSDFYRQSSAARGVFRSIGESVKSAFGGIGKTVSSQFGVVKGAVQSVSGALTGNWHRALEGVKGMTKSAFKLLPTDIRNGAKLVVSAITNPFSTAVSLVRGFVNQIISVINTVLGPIGVHIGGGGGSGKLPKSSTAPHSKTAAQKRATGGKVTAPMAIVGEEAPQHPEWVIASNPAYRQRNVGLWMQAAQALDIPGFAAGGKAGGASVGAGKAGRNTRSVGPSIGNLNFPSPSSFLPSWLAPAGSWVVNKATDWAANKIASGGKNILQQGISSAGSLAQSVLPFASGGIIPPKRGSHWAHVLSGRSPRGGMVSVDEAATLLWQAGLSAGDAGELSRVVPGESGGNPSIVNSSSGATGLFQILGSVYPGNLKDPRINALNAAIKWRTQGRGAWEAASSGPAGRILQEMVGGGGKLPRSKGKGTGKAGTLGLPAALQNAIDLHSTFSDRYEDYAQRANSLKGAVLGMDEIGWLQEELKELFTLRNLLIQAIQKLQEEMAKLQKMIEAAKRGARSGGAQAGGQQAGGTLANLKNNSWVDSHTLEVTKFLDQKFGLHMTSGYRSPAHNAAIRGAPGSLHTHGNEANPGATDSVGSMGQMNAYVAWAKANVAGLKEAMVDNYAGLGSNAHLGFFRKGGVLEFFKKGGKKGKKGGGGGGASDPGKVLDDLKQQRDDLQSKLSDITSSLDDVQGPAGPMSILGSATVGDLGGRIFDVQSAINTAHEDATATDSSSAESKGLSSEDLKNIGYLRDLGVSFYPSQFAGTFGGGGVVGGPPGVAQGAVVHGGEVILTPEQAQAIGRPVILVEDGAVNADRIRHLSGEEADRRLKGRDRNLRLANMAKAGG